MASRRLATSPFSKLVIACASLVPVLCAIVVVVGTALLGSGGLQLACWILPNGSVLQYPGDHVCPMRPSDRVELVRFPDVGVLPYSQLDSVKSIALAQTATVDLGVMREGRLIWLAVPAKRLDRYDVAIHAIGAGVVALALSALPALLALRATSPAILPLSLLCATTGVLFVALASGWRSDHLAYAAIAAMMFTPSVLGHLGLVFPRERQLHRDTPRVVLIPYSVLAVLIPAGLLIGRGPSALWPIFVVLLQVLTALGWLLFIAVSWFSIRESNSAVERSRARAVCLGALLIPILPSLLLARSATRISEAFVVFVWMSALLLPWAVAFSVARHNLLDTGLDTRRLAGRLISVLAASGLVAMVLILGLPATGAIDGKSGLVAAFAVAFVCVSAVEMFRRPISGVSSSIVDRKSRILDRVGSELEGELVVGSDEDELAELLLRAAFGAFRPEFIAVFVRSGDEWRLSSSSGWGGTSSGTIASEVAEIVGDRRVVNVAAEVLSNPEQLPDWFSDVEVVVQLNRGGSTYGIAILGQKLSGDAYGSSDLDHLCQWSSRTAEAIWRSRLEEKLVRSERQATRGQMALTMAHDVAKELGWMRRLLERLPDRVIDMTRLRRDVDILVDFTDGIAEQLRSIVVDSIAWSDEPSEYIGCEDVVRHAIERVSRLHHAASVVDSVDPAVRNLPCHENVSRILVNLLDNAIRASGAGSPVHLYVTQRPGRIVFEVIDAGSGISELELDGAFGAGVTSRATEGGFGVGLGMCREMVEGLGGEIFLSSRLGQGTSATFWVPLTAATSVQESLHGPAA